MNFSISKPDFTKYFALETKYSIAITADDSVTKKFPVLEDGPPEVALFWRTQFDELAQLKNFDDANKFKNVLLLLSGDAKDKWINAHNDVMPNNDNPTEARFRAVWTTFIINYGASDKTAKGLRDFLQKAKKPADMKLYDFKTRLYQLNKYLPLLPGPHGHVASMMPTCSTPFRNLFQIGTIPTLPQTPPPKTSTIFSSTMENSNSKKPRESQKPVIRTMPSCNSNQPETRINAVKDTKTNATSSSFFLSFNLHHDLQPFEAQFHQVPHFRDQVLPR
jgi:hypothetical protein